MTDLNDRADAGATTVTVGDHTAHLLPAQKEPEKQLTKALSDLAAALPTASALAAHADSCSVESIAITPDFHGGKPMPVGVVTQTTDFLMPHAIGNDIGCGMRSVVLPEITEQDVVENRPALMKSLRHVFFQGGRHLSLSGRQRRAILRDGLIGLLETLADHHDGLLGYYDRAQCEAELDHTCDLGAFAADDVVDAFDAFCGEADDVRRDSVLGTIGGGNHFVELQVVERIADNASAHCYGLAEGQIVVTVHSGSLGFGQNVGTTVAEQLRAAWSGRTGADVRVLALSGPTAGIVENYLAGLANATNAAFANRLFLGLATIKALSDVLGRRFDHRLIYDAPHNVIWRQAPDQFLHRKGACPARGPQDLGGTPFAHVGEPVILPGSMGDATWILAGCGSGDTLSSSAHGAGRRLTRQEARREPFAREDLSVVGPIDLDDPQVRRRPDIVAEARERLAEEAPNAYRPIDNVVGAMVAQSVVRPVARLRPLVTAKG